MENLIKTKITNHIQHRLDKHLEKHGHKHVHRVLRHIENIHHNWFHIGELLVILCIGRGSLLFANYNTSYEIYHRASMNEANTYLAQAIKSGKPGTDSIISTREIDSSVNNTFAAGYCTYGAARISPEFFPYSADKTAQQRTWGGNAIDRCENAAAANFKVGPSPAQGALVVFNGGNGVSSLGHVGKVMYYNNKTQYMVVRDMNWLARGIMVDHRENISTANIKCYIYAKQLGEDKQTVDTSSELKDTTDILSAIIPNPTNTTNTTQDTLPTNTIQDTTSANESTNTEKKEDVHNAPLLEPEQTHGILASENITHTKKIQFNSDNISDIAKHFLEKYNISIEKNSKDYPSLGETISISLKIQDKTSNEYFDGVLPFAINLIPSNTNITSSMSKIQLIQGNSISVLFNIEKSGPTTILISLDDDTIAKIPVTIID